jgi:membrane-associated phospholipid phosphatase
MVELSNLDGIVTFPSFHAAAAVLLAWAASGIPFLRYPMIALNFLMLISAIPIGGHYAIDVIAGSLVAAVSIVAARVWANLAQPGLGLRPVRVKQLVD